MYLEGLEKKKGEMIIVYKYIHKAIFRYGIFFIILILSVYISQLASNHKTSILQISDTDSNQKILSIQTYQKKINEIQSTGNLKIFVGLGNLSREDNKLSSYNNLAVYSGFVLPRYFSADIGIFNKTGFTKETMEDFFSKFIMVTNESNGTLNNTQLIEIPNTIEETFNLQCVFQTKIYNGLCKIFTDNFVNTFMLYDIEKDINGFKNIFNQITKTNLTYKVNICQDLLYHSYYANKASDGLKSIVQLCREKIVDTFNKFSLFSEIQTELETKNISTKTYSDTIANAYKINSTIQIIDEDMRNNRVNLMRINNYLNLTEELLKQNTLDTIETSIIYYFNNYRLKNKLQNPELLLKIDNKSDLSNILTRLNSINNGNILIGYEGLKYKVDESLVDKDIAINTSEKDPKEYQKNIENLLDQLSIFMPEDKVISGNQILTKGIFSTEIRNGKSISTLNLEMKLQLEEQSNILFIKRVEIINQAEISQTINKIIGNQQRSFGDLQSYIGDNANLFVKEDVSNEESFCDQARAEIIDTIGTVDVCNETSLILSREVKGKLIRFGINYEQYIFKGIDVPDQTTKEIITEYLNRPSVIKQYSVINRDNMISLAKSILALFDGNNSTGKDTQDLIGDENTIIIIETIERYLKTNVTDIAAKGDKAAVTFSIGNMNLIGNYNIKTHTIEQMYFKDIKLDGAPAIIKNSSLVLDDEHIDELKLFIKNPLDFLKNRSPENYLLYMKSKK